MSREIRLARRPAGEPVAGDFAVAQAEVRSPAGGELLVANTFMSVDPYMRHRMNASMVHMDPWPVGGTLDGAAVGQVLESRSPLWRPGDLVLHGLGWRERAVLPAAEARPVPDPEIEASAYLGVLGLPGITAWYALLRVGCFVPGETVFVSAAAGAVGSTVGQLVRHYGGTVIGSAGSPAKARALTAELGFDAAFCYRDADSARELAALAPGGIDLYIDNVGGDQLAAALEALRPHGRIVACGMIAHANGDRPGPANLPLIVGKRLSMRGFIVSDHYDERPAFEREVVPLVRSGRLRAVQTVVSGLDRAPEALIGLLRGDNTGKMVVAL